MKAAEMKPEEIRQEEMKQKDINFNPMEKGEQTMKKTVKIEGMMCMHCVKAVEKALTAVEGVTGVSVSLEDKQAVVEGTAEAEALKAAVVDAGYEVTDIA